MKPGLALLRATGVVLGLQLLLGGLLTFGFISPAAHIAAGFLLFALAVATMAVWLVTKPAFKPLQRLSVVIVLLLIIQIVLGFATLDTGNQLMAFLHFANALAIFGATMGATFTAMRWERMTVSGGGVGQPGP